MAAYAVCLLVVVSFISFEVLDLDGSDFARPLRTAMTIKIADPEHDLRRAALQTPSVAPLILSALSQGAETLQSLHVLERARGNAPARSSTCRDFRDALPRSLLPDTVLSA
jgi:hypothetical protein